MLARNPVTGYLDSRILQKYHCKLTECWFSNPKCNLLFFQAESPNSKQITCTYAWYQWRSANGMLLAQGAWLGLIHKTNQWPQLFFAHRAFGLFWPVHPVCPLAQFHWSFKASLIFACTFLGRPALFLLRQNIFPRYSAMSFGGTTWTPNII